MRHTIRATTIALALLGASAPLHAQQKSQPKAPKRPDYQTLRFEERWDAGTSTPDAFDPLKHVSLGGGAFVTFAGQERLRGERVSHLGLGGAGATDGFALERLRLSADLHVGAHLRAFAEARDSRASSRDLPGGARPQDDDHWDAQNAFVELDCCRAGSRYKGALRAGRQELMFDRERLVSPGDWTNAPRTFQGVRATGGLYAASVEAFSVHPVVLDQHAVNGPDLATRFSGARLQLAAGPASVQLYYYDLRQDSVKFAGTTGAQARSTAGAHASGKTHARWLAYDLEGAQQRGSIGPRRIAAWFVASDLTASAAGTRGKPSLGIGLDASSGDRDAKDRVLGTFHQLYPSGHAFLGYADVLGRQNVTELRAVATAAPTRTVQARLAGHHFLRTALADGLYTTAGAALRPAAGSRDRTAGDEVDATATWQLGAHLKLAGGYAHFAPGAFLRHSTAGAHPVDWAFATTTFTF